MACARLTPTAPCGRRFRGLLEPPGFRPGIIYFKSVAPPTSRGIGDSRSHWAHAWGIPNTKILSPRSLVV